MIVTMRALFNDSTLLVHLEFQVVVCQMSRRTLTPTISLPGALPELYKTTSDKFEKTAFGRETTRVTRGT